jgi:cell division protein FtsI/penicillin-binding protein 2
VRELLLAVVALAALAGIAFGGWWLLNESDLLGGGDDEAAQAQDTLDAYAAAWSDGDHDAMAELVRDPPEEFVEVHDQLVEGTELEDLEVVASEARTGGPDGTQDGRANATLTITATLPGGRDLAWETDVELLRERGAWGLVWGHAVTHPDLRAGYRFAREVEPVDRAPILAADGTTLAGSGERVTFGFEPTSVDDAEAFAEAMEEAIPGSGATAERLLDRRDLVDGWFYPVVTVSAARADEAAPLLREVTGVLRRSGEGRTLLAEGFAQHVVGRVDEATAEQLAELGEPYEAGDEVGQFGLERVFETDLVGGEQVTVLLREGEDGPVRHVLDEHTTGAEAIETTIDVVVQQAIENALVGIDRDAAIVVVDARDGAIRGSASRPLSGYNRAFDGRYPPGSTFKIVTAEALLASGMTPDDEVACPSETTVGGLRVPNAGGLDLGTTTMEAAFADSCNTTFARLAADELGDGGLTDAAGRFGFGVEHELPLSSFGGSFPDPADSAELGAAAFGQARVEASPLHLASVAAATASGTWHRPYLLVQDADGPASDLAAGITEDLRRLLRAVVIDGNGGAADVAGVEVRGKTGTAQADGGAVEHAWFLGTVGDLGFAVLVEDGGSGAEAAAPIAGRLVAELEALRERAELAEADDAEVEDGEVEDTDGEGAEDLDDVDDDPDIEVEDGAAEDG